MQSGIKTGKFSQRLADYKLLIHTEKQLNIFSIQSCSNFRSKSRYFHVEMG